MIIRRFLLALVLGILGAWIGSDAVYRNHNPINKNDPLHRTEQKRTPENEWKWWVGVFAGGFIGLSLPFLSVPDRR